MVEGFHLVLAGLFLLGSSLMLVGEVGERMLVRNERRRIMREAAQRRRDRKEPYGG